MSDENAQWSRRPVLAALVRVFVWAAPFAMAVGSVLILGRVVPRPTGFLLVAAWWVGLTLSATVVLWLVDRFLRRLLPVIALFKLSLVFPDRAPSRFKTAIRSGTVRSLQRQVESGDFSGSTPQEAAEQLIALAGSLNAHDRLTRGHTERVRAYSAMIGEEMGLKHEELELLNWSGLVHDIGKLSVPTEILNKAGKPTDEEWGVLRDHPAKADLLIEPLRPWLGQWAESATQHHERFDGNGYPNGLAGHDITLAGRIVAVADAYDVMTSTRSYKKPMSAVDARSELAANAGTQFDPDVVRAFLNVALGRLRLVMGPLSALGQFPAGSASLGSSAITGAGALASVVVAGVLGVPGPPPEPIESLPEAVAFVEAEAVDHSFVSEEDTSFSVGVRTLVDGPIQSIDVIDRPDHGTVELSDDGTITFVPEPDFNGTVTIGYLVCFEDGSCDEGVITIVVGGTNDTPLAAPDAMTMLEDHTELVNVLVNDTDIDGDQLTVVEAQIAPEPGSNLNDTEVSIVDNMIMVTPPADVSGSFVISYTVADPSWATASSTALIDVSPVDDPPVARGDTLTVLENTARELDVLANDFDLDGDPLTIGSITEVTGGIASTDGDTVTFLPYPRYVGPAGFFYTIDDGTSTATAKVDLTVVDITDRPFLVPDSVTIDEDTATVTVDALGNDVAFLSPLDPTTVTIIRAPAHGTTAWDGSTFVYAPDPAWNGIDDFDYLVCDELEFCNITTVTVTIIAVNDAPSFTPGPDLLTVEDPGPQTLTGWATAISPGPANETTQTLAFTVTATNPTLFTNQPAITPTGDLTYTPGPNANGTTNLTITLTDNGGTTNGGTDTTTHNTTNLTITPVNDDPIAVDDGPSVAEDDVAGVTFDVLLNDSDVDGDTVSYGSADTSTVTDGTITDHLDGTFTYIPDEHHNGVETFTYTAVDGNGGTATATVTITITPLPDAPVASNDAQATLVDAPLSVPAPGLMVNDYDVDGEALTVNTTPVTPPANGAVTLNADGSYLYTPDPGYVGTDSFTYEISDPGLLTATATATITVDSGVVIQSYYLGDTGSAAWDYDLVGSAPPSSNPVFDSDSDGDPGLTIDNSDGDDEESDPTKYQLWSLTAATPLELDGPVTLDLWSSVKSFDIDEGGHPVVYLYDCLGASCTLLTETDVHTNNWNQGVANFTNRQIDLGSVTHTVAAGRDLVVRLQFKHEDMWVAMTADYPSALDVTLANEPPVAADDAVTIDEDDPATNITVLTNDTDADIDPATVTITTPASSGLATPVGDGTVDYTPDPDFNGIDTFEYQVCDLGGNCDTATVTVTVDAVNDEPSFTGGGAVIAIGFGPNTFPGWATAISPGPADEAGQALTFAVTANDNPALFTVGPAVDPISGDLTFDAAFSGIANITIELRDNGGTANGGDDTSPTYNFVITIP